MSDLVELVNEKLAQEAHGLAPDLSDILLYQAVIEAAEAFTLWCENTREYREAYTRLDEAVDALQEARDE